MTRPEAFETLNTYAKNPSLIKHHLACEAIMIALCHKLIPNPDEIVLNKWGSVGLLHDADYDQTRDHPEKHTMLLEQELGKKLDQDVMYAIKAHNFTRTGAIPQSLMDWSMYTCDELSGFIMVAALSHPDKKLASLDVEFILKRFNDSSFAKGANRNQIRICETRLKIPLAEFIQIALAAMQNISDDLNL